MSIPSMFDTQYAMDRQMQNDAMNAGQLPLGGGMMYASSLSGDIYNQGLMGLAGLMGGAPSPEMAKQQALEEVFQQFGNPQTPDDAIAIADALQAKGLYGEAMQFMNFANEMRASMPKAIEPKTYQDNYGATRYLNSGTTWQAGTLVPGETAKEAEKDTRGADAIVKDNILKDFIAKNDGDETKGAYDYKKFMDKTESLKLNPLDFNAFSKALSQTSSTFNPIKKNIKKTENLQLLLGKAKEDKNSTAWNQSARLLASLVGDSNLSSLEVKTVSEGGSFPDRLINTLSKWASGVPAETKIEEVLDVVKALDKSLKDDYNGYHTQFTGAYTLTGLSPELIPFMLGEKYITKPTINNYTEEELAEAIARKIAEQNQN